MINKFKKLLTNKQIFERVFLFLLVFYVVNLSFKDWSYSVTSSSTIRLEVNPHGIAINPITDIAVITNEKSDSISIVNLNTQKVLSTIPVGKSPRGVAVDIGLNIGLVGNSHDNNISIIDLNNFQIITTIPVGKGPEGIAVNQLNHTALVSNHKENTVTVIDLLNYNVMLTIPVGKEPKDIAIDPELNLALVVNEKEEEDEEDEDKHGKEEGEHYAVTVIDLRTYQVTNEVSVRKNPQAIDINPETHFAVVANTKDNSITVINLLNYQTTSILVGKHPRDAVINPLDNKALVICDEDDREYEDEHKDEGGSLLLIDLNTNTIIKKYEINKKSKGLAVNNFMNIAAVVDDKTDSLALIQLPNPVPQITSINPSTVYRGSAGEHIEIEGSKFIKTSKVYFENKLLETIFIDNHHLKVNIPGDLFLKAGKFYLTIVNPSPE